MNTASNQIPNAASASPGSAPAVARHVGRPEGHNVVEALSGTGAKGDLTMLKVRIVHVFATFLLLASIAVLGGCSKKEAAAVPTPRPQPVSQAAPPAPPPAAR